MLTNEVGEVTSHLQGMFTRTIRLLEVGIKPVHLQEIFTRIIRLLEVGIKPVYVFYAEPPDLKKQELAKRYSKRADATDDLSDALEVGSKEGIEKFSKRTIEVEERV